VPTENAKEYQQIAPTFPGSYYCDPEILEKEWVKIFHRTWLCVGRESNVSEPGDFLTVQVGAENILIIRDKQGQLGAFYNVCRHRGTKLCVEATGHLAGNQDLSGTNRGSAAFCSPGDGRKDAVLRSAAETRVKRRRERHSTIANFLNGFTLNGR
jgi:hypothetical protein